MDGTMFRVDFVTSPPTALSAQSLNRPTDLETWHRRLAHISEGTIRDMAKHDVVDGLSITTFATNGRCEDCIIEKQFRRPFDTIVVLESQPFEHVAFDIWGPARVHTSGGKSLMLVAMDQGSAGCEAWYLANKAKETTVACLESFDARVKTQYGLQVKCIRTDGGKEFDNNLWAAYCTKRGIDHETTPPHSSAANGVVEQRNRTILDLACSMLANSQLLTHYWGEATSTAIHVLDIIPSSCHPGKMPFEICTGRRLDVLYLRPFGCVAYAKVPREDGTSKLDTRSVKCVLVGYFGKGDYKLLD